MSAIKNLEIKYKGLNLQFFAISDVLMFILQFIKITKH